MLRNTLLITVMLMICSVAYASDTDWSWSFGQGYFAHFGTSISASDDVDACDVRISDIQYYYYGTYNEGDTGFYSTDIRAPLQLMPGQSKTWTFYLWADPSYPQGPSGDHLEMMWGWSQPAPAFSKMRYVLTYVRSAEGVTGGNTPVGSSVILNQYQQGTWSFPVYRTIDGQTGYMFEFTATVVPEPSSIAALGMALAGVGIIRKRRLI